MLVILGVAADACPRQFNFVGDCNFVTRSTFNVPMSTRKRIGGLRVVIELPTIPAVRVVAGAAGFAERALVIVPIRMAIAAYLRHAGEVEFRMTGLTRGRCMNADQRELGKRMVEGDRMPCDFGMTALTRAIAPAMRIVLLVAADTRFRQLVGQFATMAAFAAQRFVRALQRKAGFRKMVELALPSRFTMAVGALAAETAVMMVVGAVTTIAVLRRFLDRHVVEVTGAADQFLVSAYQRKAGLFEMIERHATPLDRVVARCAIGATTALVYIVGAVARDTCLRQAFPYFINMATLTDDLDVRAA